MKQKKFALVDQSIKGAGGHHLEYALRVLDAAHSEGYAPILGAGREFEPEEDLAYPSVSCFRYTFWENLQRQSAIGELILRYGEYRKARRETAVRRKQRKKYRHYYSKSGLDEQRALDLPNLRHELMEIFASELSPIPSGKYALTWHRYRVDYGNRFRALIQRAIRLYRRIPKLFRYPLYLVRTSVAKGYRFLLRSLRRLLKLVAALIVGPVALLVAPFILRKPHRAAFESDMKAFLRSGSLGAGDIAFVPTLGETEMLAIADLCRRYPLARKIRWRLLFRRDLFSGRPIHHSAQGDYVPSRRFRLALEEVKRKTLGVDIAFSTDTEPLSAQYNRPNAFPFKTVPIPVDASFRAANRSESSRPLTVGYLGDARDEKGFPLLAQAMDKIYQSHVVSNKTTLLAQSNFNVEGGEPGSIEARLALLALPSNARKLVEGPFSSEEYVALFKAADIMLAPYNPEAYASRSSGVFAEALVAGLPALITRGSWMATIMEPYRQAYAEALEAHLPRQNLFDPNAVKNQILNRRSLGEATLGDLGYAGDFDFRSHILVRMDFPRVDKDLHVSVNAYFHDIHGQFIEAVGATIWLCQSTLRCFVRIPDKAATARINILPLDGLTKVVPDQVAVRSVALPKGTPSSFAGIIVEPTASGVAYGISELSDHHTAYRAMAKSIANRWAEYCDARTLVKLLDHTEREEPSPEHYASKDVEAFLSADRNGFWYDASTDRGASWR